MKLKFEEGGYVEANVNWSSACGFVEKIGIRYKKDKKGRDVFETNTYLIKDENGKLHYFFEDEIQ